MRTRVSAPGGFTLLMAMTVVVLMTLLVVGAIAFTGHERSASVVHTRSEALEGCAQAARDLFLARVRVLRANVGSVVLDTQLGTKMRVQTRHYDGTVALDTVTPVPGNRVSGGAGLEQDLSNRVGRSPLLAGYYQVTALCEEGTTGREQEIEFVARVGL